MTLAFMYAQTGEIEMARYTFAPVAADPHGGARAEIARRSVEELADAAEGSPFRFSFFDEEKETETAAANDPVSGTE